MYPPFMKFLIDPLSSAATPVMAYINARNNVISMISRSMNKMLAWRRHHASILSENLHE